MFALGGWRPGRQPEPLESVSYQPRGERRLDLQELLRRAGDGLDVPDA
jgi:hypothetical protein